MTLTICSRQRLDRRSLASLIVVPAVIAFSVSRTFSKRDRLSRDVIMNTTWKSVALLFCSSFAFIACGTSGRSPSISQFDSTDSGTPPVDKCSTRAKGVRVRTPARSPTAARSRRSTPTTSCVRKASARALRTVAGRVRRHQRFAGDEVAHGEQKFVSHTVARNEHHLLAGKRLATPTPAAHSSTHRRASLWAMAARGSPTPGSPPWPSSCPRRCARASPSAVLLHSR